MARHAVNLLHLTATVATGITVHLATAPHLPAIPTPTGALPTAWFAALAATLAAGLGLDHLASKAHTALRRT
ncbi:hypothetical protein [Streptomyces cupreus]|uniref:Uncharacterized protein n=1 Tax=Streptomyces cupreus TaxID=2759956 RepID=A0A7X1J4R6_9ACTN|nr:hypothetical protein [Streptomyces cupreus]MBC2903167.1 hypothetical protein [Streptomyces cupreus]